MLFLPLSIITNGIVYGAESIEPKNDSLININYGSNTAVDGKNQVLTMNIFFPEKVEGKKYPMVLLMHGGGFLTGRKENMNGYCKILADSGFIAVTINYRKGWDRGSHPFGCEGDIEGLEMAGYRGTQDARGALRFLVNRQQAYSIDTAWIFVGGSSAGAVLALNSVYLNDAFAKTKMKGTFKELGSLDDATSKSKNTFTVKGICSMWGGLPDSTLVTISNAVPTIFFHGTADVIVPYDMGRYGSICNNYPMIYGSACIYRQTLAAGKPGVLNTSIDGNHGPKEFYSKVTMSNTACFFRKIMLGKAMNQLFNNGKQGCR